MLGCVMYVGCYTNESENGIHIYDIDKSNGKLSKKETVKVFNSSYITLANSKPVLYSVTDIGVASFAIIKDGGLSMLNEVSTRAMRGCCLDTDKEDRFIFVGGYHDGKITMMSVNDDGSVGEVLDTKHHKNAGNGTDRMSMGHVCCVKVTPDNNHICAVDSGLEQVKIYKIDKNMDQMVLIDILRCELDFEPVKMEFSKDGKYAYLLSESKKQINVYKYESKEGYPSFTLIQKITTVGEYHTTASAACSLRINKSDKYLTVSNDGDNTVSLYEIEDGGTLIPYCVLPISGKYPKDVVISCDNKYLYSVNHDENTITSFLIDYDKKLFTMCAKPVKIESPNSVLIADLDELFKG